MTVDDQPCLAVVRPRIGPKQVLTFVARRSNIESARFPMPVRTSPRVERTAQTPSKRTTPHRCCRTATAPRHDRSQHVEPEIEARAWVEAALRGQHQRRQDEQAASMLEAGVLRWPTVSQERMQRFHRFDN